MVRTTTRKSKTKKPKPATRGAAKAKPRKVAGRKSARPKTRTKASTKAMPKPKLLSGGNPQIEMGYGAAPIRAYIAAMPGWKRAVGRMIDAIVTRAVPNVSKAVKWNSPLYGVEGKGWFLGLHCFNRYVKLTFFNGGSLAPLPPGLSKYARVRHLDIREGDAIDAAQIADWVKKASKLPGERM